MPFSDIKNEVEDRVSSPLRGGYLVALILLNWKTFVVAFDFDMSAVERIKIIEQQFSPYLFFGDQQIVWIVILPLLIAIAINFIVTAVEYYPKKFKIYKEKQLVEYSTHDTEVMKIAKAYKAAFDPLLIDFKFTFYSASGTNEQGTRIDPHWLYGASERLNKRLEKAIKFQEEMKSKYNF